MVPVTMMTIEWQPLSWQIQHAYWKAAAHYHSLGQTVHALIDNISERC